MPDDYCYNYTEYNQIDLTHIVAGSENIPGTHSTNTISGVGSTLIDASDFIFA